MKRLSVSFIAIVTVMILSGCASTDTTNQVVKSVGSTAGGVAGGLIGGLVPGGGILGAAVGSLAGGAIRYGVNYSLDQQADDIAKSLGTGVNNDPLASLDPDQHLIISDNKKYVKIMFRGGFMFPVNSSRLTPTASRKVDILAQVLKKYPDTIIQTAGFTDNRGSYKRNYNLSRRRAKSVSDKLYQAGVNNPSYVTGCSYKKPIVANSTKQNMALNRRVEIYLYPSKSERIDPCE